MKKMLSVTFFTAALTLLRMLTNFIIAKSVAIYAGPSGIAILGQMQNLLNIFFGTVNSTVSTGVVRYTSEYSEKGLTYAAPWLRASICWMIIFLCILVPTLALSSYRLSELLFETESYYWVLIVFACVLPLAALGTFINSIINGLQKYKIYVSLGAVSVIISACLMLYLVIQYSIKGALLAAALQNSIIGLVLIIYAFRQPWFKFRVFFGRIESAKLKDILRYIFMAATSAIAVPISMIFVRDILVKNVGWDITGNWQSVWKISEAYLSIITMALSTWYLPQLAKTKSFVEIKREISHTAKLVMPLVTIMAIAVYMLRDLIIKILFTNDFDAALSLFGVQLIGDVVKILAWIFAFPILAKGAVHFFTLTEITFAVLLVVLTWILVPLYGAQGANYAYLMNYLIYLIWIFLNLKKVVS